MLNQTTTDQRGLMPGAGTTAMGTGMGAQHGAIGQMSKQGIQPPSAGLGTTAGLNTAGSGLGNTTTRF
jgi:hypothetical protein